MSDKVKVHINASQRVRFSQEVWMERSEFKRLNSLDDDCEMSDEIEPFIDLMDIFDGDGIEDVELKIVSNGEPARMPKKESDK